MKVFREIFRKLVPSWLSKDDGELVLFSTGTVLDATQERAREAALASMPSYCPPDALGPMGRDRQIIRGWNEPGDVYAERLLSWLDDHQVRGNAFALFRQLRGYLGVDLMIRTVDAHGNWYTREVDGSTSVLLQQGNWDWDGSAETLWSRFWVILYPPASLWTEGAPWGDPDQWGGAWGTSGYTWGTTATPEQVSTVREIVRQWKPAGTRCVKIIVAFDSASFDPESAPGAPGMPDGTWHKPYVVVDGAAVPNRLATARYWRGT